MKRILWTVLSVALAMPKSQSLTSPFHEQMTFEGETSRWTMQSGRPAASTRLWAAWSPSATSAATFSLGAHWALPPSALKFSRISVEGVPG